jgi:outer membrane protein OmpA-like peptidoglycan-associated protein
MKKTNSIIFTLVCAITLTAALTGCSGVGNGKTPAEKAAVCYVIANTANSKGLNFNSPLVQDTVYSAVRNYGFISVVSADGKPEIVHAASYDIDDKYKSASKEKLDMDARSKAKNIVLGMQNIVADDPEVDYLESLRLAVRTLSSLDGYDSKIIVLMGTGLSTAGVMNFSNNLIVAEPETIVNLLNEKSEIPNFTGITVYSQQLGDVAAPQQELTSVQRLKLEKIYGGIVETGGGTFIYNDIIANPVDTTKQYPSVTPVNLPSDTPISFEEVVFEEDNLFEEPVFLSEERIGFVADKAVFFNPDEASKTLQPVAEYLVNHPLVSIVLAGTTAGDVDSDFTMTLSRQRAETVKNALIGLGINGDRIVAIGLGSEKDPWHIYNAGYDGAAASWNRKVVLLDASSERAASILELSNH